MSIMSIIAAILVFGLIILIHEFGHFIFAKRGGIGVVEFSMGMGPRLFSFEKGGTRYSLKILPFGGSCMMVGEDEEASGDESFNNKSVWVRIKTIAAGPIFNFILAFVLAFIIISVAGYDSARVSSVSDGFPAQEAGLQAGDVITKLNDKKIVFFRDIISYMYFHPSNEIKVGYERDGQSYETVVSPVYNQETSQYLLGVQGSVRERTANPLVTLKYSVSELRYWIQYVFESLGKMIRGEVKMEEMAGPIKIVSILGESVEENKEFGIATVLLNLANYCVLLSANLGVMNLLPIPALDGGRLVFLFLEAVRGKPIDKEKEGIVHMAGMAALMTLMVFILFNDIRSFF